MRLHPGHKISYCELDVETYPTDGYDTERAFFSMAAAKRCEEWLSRNAGGGLRTRLHRVDLALGADGQVYADGCLWGDYRLRHLNGSDEYGWRQTLEYCVGRGTVEPDFEAAAAADLERDHDSDEHEPT